MYTDESAVSYEGLSDAEALTALYHGTRALGLGVFHDKGGFSVADAEKYLGDAKVAYFDYVAGRPLKLAMDREKKIIGSPRLYDRDAGDGACKRAIERALAAKAAAPASAAG